MELTAWLQFSFKKPYNECEDLFGSVIVQKSFKYHEVGTGAVAVRPCVPRKGKKIIYFLLNKAAYSAHMSKGGGPPTIRRKFSLFLNFWKVEHTQKSNT